MDTWHLAVEQQVGEQRFGTGQVQRRELAPPDRKINDPGRRVRRTRGANLSVFAVSPDGLSLVETVATGRGPRSAAEHAGLVYVLNTGGRPSRASG